MTAQQRSPNQGLRIVCPNGHLGFAPIKTGSFHIGLKASPDIVACDSGSNDVGPGPLGSDGTASPLAWQIHDLEEMLVGARRLGKPMIIGSAGDTGANSAGALLGTALVQRSGRGARLGALAVLAGLTLASERVSFTKVIESTPGLRELDALGRR